jgi:septal ring factor EnvC (AmiA/AmiB activator)
MADSLKKDTKKMEERIDDIEKRMEQLLKKEKENLLAEVEDAVQKRKSKMPKIDDEE